MLRRSFMFTVVLTLMATWSLAQEGDKPRLKPFTPKGTNLKVALPGDPVESSQFLRGTRAKWWRAEENKQGYAVMVMEIPEKVLKEDSRSPDERLRAALSGGLSFAIANDVEPKKLLLANKYPGLESTANIKGEGRSIRARSYLIDDQLVHLIVSGKAEFVNADEATKFLDSLELVK